MSDITNQIKRVETAAELTKRASMLGTKTAAINLGDETLALLKMFAVLCGQLEKETKLARKELSELKGVIGGNDAVTE